MNRMGDRFALFVMVKDKSIVIKYGKRGVKTRNIICLCYARRPGIGDKMLRKAYRQNKRMKDRAKICTKLGVRFSARFLPCM